MPTYEFQCQDCGKEFSEIMSISQRSRKKPPCPKCKSRKVDQLVSGFMAITSRKS
jgi:putative FmdB family regulatory protein